MPQAPDRLQKKFMTPADQDGIGTCEEILKPVCEIKRGVIGVKPGAVLTAEHHDAIDFLVMEWDYGFVTNNT